MVYRGKPSKSCRQCRRRNLKCDRCRNSCGQCTRAHLDCPGYPDPLAVIIRDETRSVVRKASRAVILTPPLLPPLEVRAKHLFASHYVRKEAPTFPYIQSVYNGEPTLTPLAISVEAVSLAYLGSIHASVEILYRARQRYSTALRLTNAALRSSDTVKDNTTLFTVLLLDLFEKLTQNLEPAWSDESKHIDGALALLQLAGPEQFDDDVRLHLFHQVCLKTLHRCLEKSMEIPPDLITLRNSIKDRSPAWDVEEVLIRFIAFRSSIRKGDIPRAFMDREAEELDRLLGQMCTGQTLAWKFRDAVMETISAENVVDGICVSNTDYIKVLKL